MPPLYTVVYGPKWEDIAYYSDLTKAKTKTKLLVQTLANEDRYVPAMYEYHEDDGMYHHQSKRLLMVDRNELNTLNVKTLHDFRAMYNKSPFSALVVIYTC